MQLLGCNVDPLPSFCQFPSKRLGTPSIPHTESVSYPPPASCFCMVRPVVQKL